jgi:fatty-acyl-CoA synthase
MLIGDILRRQALPTGRPNKPALLYEGAAVTYAQLNAQANRLASALLGLGVRRGDRVALLGRNSPEWVAAYYAAAKCGAILVPLNFWYRTGEVAYVLQDSGARICLLASAFAGVVAPLRSSGRGWGGEAAAGLPARPADATAIPRPVQRDEQVPVTRWIWLDRRPDASAHPESAGDPTVAELTAGLPDAEPEPPDGPLAETDPHIILYTSGTTGFPKGAVLSHRAHVLHAATFALYTRAVEEDVYLNVYPLFHTGGTDCAVLPYHYAGATVALLPDPKPEAVLAAMEAYRVTAMMAVPTVWRWLVEHPDRQRRDLSAFRRAMGSSDAMPRDLLEQVVEAFGASWTQTYGLTEAGCILTYLSPADFRRKIGSAGKPHVAAELLIADPALAGDPQWPLRPEHRLPPGETGEIVARTEHLMDGYWQKPAQTAETIRHGWLRTGDLGRLDEDGYLYIVGRLKDVIISGGEKIYPAEVEPVLRAYPGVQELALVGVPDREWGESVLAVIVPAPGAVVDADAFKAWARRQVAGYKAPRHVVFVESLPRTTGTGKVQKALLREQFRDQFGTGEGQ